MQEERMIFVIDMVNGFVKEGALADPTILKIVPSIKQLIREKKGVLVEVKESHNENSLEFKSFPPHCIKGTLEAETCDGLKDILKDSLKFYKNSTSALFAKGLMEYILKNPPKELIITGCCTDICIMNFAIPLKNLFNELGIDTEIIVYKEMVDTYNSPSHNRNYFNNIAFTLMEQSGISIKSYALEKQENQEKINQEKINPEKSDELVNNNIRKKVLNYGK